MQEEEKLLDIEDLLERVGDDEELAKEILTIFVDDCPKKLWLIIMRKLWSAVPIASKA